MPTFDYQFTVNAPQADVSAFHFNASVKTLTPFPIIAQLHDVEPLAEGSVADFTLWFGPFPVHWRAVHSAVDQGGFTDTQVAGPLQRWQHRHRFTAVDSATTLVSEHITYEYKTGLAGLVSRLMYSRPALTMLFTARKLITRRQVAKLRAASSASSKQ